MTKFKTIQIVFILCLLTSASSDAWACVTVDIGASNLDFGIYNPLDTSATTDSVTVTVDCITDPLIPPIALPFRVGISSASGGNESARQLKSGNNILNYRILRPGNSSDWGPASGPNAVVDLFEAILSPPGKTYVGNASILPRQNVEIGNYSDQLIVTIEF